MQPLADVPTEEIQLAVDGVSVRFLRARGLENCFDTASLLGVDPAPEPPYWMHLWPGAMALAHIIASAADIRPGARLLEVGCGLALPALVASMRGARVVAADRTRDPLRMARASAALNGCPLGFVQMDWARPAVLQAFDVCIGADVAYDQTAEDGLIAGFVQALRPGGIAWLADSVNTFRRSVVVGLQSNGFGVDVSHVRDEEDGHPVWVRVIEARRLE